MAVAWPGGVIPYDITKLTEPQQKQALKAMQRWIGTGGNIQFIPYTTEAEYVNFTGKTNEGNNTSFVGFQRGRRSDINITTFWWNDEWMVTHELGHVLGFFHEHARWDRDRFITIHYENIKPGRAHDYDWVPQTNWLVKTTAYDFQSIMHYRICWASSGESQCRDKDGTSPCAVICPVERQYDGVIGQWDSNGISATDAEKVRLAYGVKPPASTSHVVNTPLPRSTPEAQGISSEAILEFVKAADTNVNTMHSFMIVRHGKVISQAWWQPESADKPHILNSVSKSFNATAVGLAISEGKLSLNDPVLKFFPADAPANPSDNLKAMTVRDLLTMSCGQDTEAKSIHGAPSVKQFLAQPVVYKPGTHFLYNTMGSYTLSAIVTKVTGQTSLEYLKSRLFEPLGIENPRWDSSPEGNSLGGYGLYLCTEDIAKFGQLYLQKGKWNGKQLVPKKWIKQATRKQVSNENEGHSNIGPDWKEGYGFQFWQCRHKAYRGDGAGGQLCVVLPDQDVVIAITADTGNFQGELDAIWDKLLPAFRAKALPEDAAGQEKLNLTIANLVAHPEKKEK